MNYESKNAGVTVKGVIDKLGLTVPAASVEEVRNHLIQNEKGQVLQRFENYVAALMADPVLSGAIKLNKMTDHVEVIKDLGWKRNTDALTDTDLRYLRLYLEENYDLGNPKNIQEAVELVANEAQFHPFIDIMESLEWDGEERIRHCLHKYLGVPEDDYSYEVLKLFMMGLLERQYHPGCKFDYIPVLVGGQGAGKSTFFRLLAVKDDWFSDDLKKLNDDNVYRKMHGHVIIEMSEMLSIGNATSIEEIKAFASRQRETYKDPYDKYAKDRPRQCVFGGTTNRMDFLPLDRTGNRRFLPILVNMDNADTHLLNDEAASREYTMQMWAEAMVMYKNHDYELKFPDSLQDQLLALQKECMPDDSLAGIIQVFLDNYDEGDYVCTLQLYREALNHPYDKPNNRESRELNDIMNNSVIGWHKCRTQHRISGYGQQRAWARDGCGQDELEGADDPGTDDDGFIKVPEQMSIPFD